MKSLFSKISPYLSDRNVNYLLFILTWGALIGSMYYGTYGDPIANISNGELFNKANGLLPCILCWYQRVLMFPLAIITLTGIIRKEMTYLYYLLPLSTIGGFIAIYHYYIQKFGGSGVIPCSLDNPCTAIQVEYLGFITIPFMSLVIFLAVACVAIAKIKQS